MPYIMGYIKGLNRIGQIIIDLIPKYYVTPRSIPVVLPDGKRDYQTINVAEMPKMNYDPNDLEIKVEAGVNFAVQKQVAMEQIERLMQVNQTFAEFMNEYGLEVMLDNLDIRGIDGLKEKALEFMQSQQQQKQQQQEMAMQMNPAILKMQEKQMEVEQQQQKAQLEYIAKTQRTAVDKQSADTDFIKVMSEIEGQNTEQAIKQEQIDAENARTAVDMALSVARHQNEVLNTNNK